MYKLLTLLFIILSLSTTLFALPLQSLHLKSNATHLKVGDTVTLSVVGTYADNSTKILTSNIEYLITPSQSVRLSANTLEVLKDGSVTVQATVDGVKSNTINLDIVWIVNAHTLPPEPDKVVNDATLLGIDSNDNGVRDDVERWIYDRYKEYIPCKEVETVCHGDNGDFECYKTICEEHSVPYHPVVRAVAMQGARAAQIIIQEPEKARETTVLMDDAQDCEISIMHLKKRIYNNQEYPAIEKYSFKEGNGLVAKLFNTVQRARAYAKYNFYLSGGVYEVPTDEEGLNRCNDEVKALLKDLK